MAPRRVLARPVPKSAPPSSPVGQEVPKSVNASDHFDITIKKLGEAGGAGHDGSPPADELAGGGEGLFERFLELVSAERVSQDGVDLALQGRCSFRRVENLDDLRGVDRIFAGGVSVVDDTEQ